jgi:hypothetical protein
MGIAAASPGVVWVVYDESLATSWVLRWDGATTTVLGSLPDQGLSAFVVRTSVYVGGDQHLWEVDLGGGSVSKVARPWQAGATLLAANDSAVFFTGDGLSIVRRDQSNGAETQIATGLLFGPKRSTYADATAVYVATQQGIERVPVGGGSSAIFANDRPVYAIAGDDCNVYFATDHGPGREPVKAVPK